MDSAIDRHYTQERVQVAKAYPGKKWAAKVLEMSDGQVHQIWIELQKKKEKEAKKS